jgi:WD40 repeat protein
VDLHLCFSPDGKRLASGSSDLTVKVWNPATGQELLTLRGHTREVSGLSFSPDGRILASAGGEGAVKLWETAAGQDVRFLEMRTEAVTGVGFSSDSKRILGRDAAGKVCSWDRLTGQEITPCTDAAQPDGQKEAVSADGTLRIYADGSYVCGVLTDDKRPPSDLVFLTRLNDIGTRLRWHRGEAQESETKQQWFAAAFHLRRLIDAKEADVEQLQGRLKRCEERLRQP